MRYSYFVLLAGIAVSSCESGENDVVPTQFTRTFGTVQCTLTGGPGNNTPCLYSSTGSNSSYVDSGRVVFNGSNGVQYMLGRHHTNLIPPVTVTNLTGTYTIVADTVLLQLGETTLRFRGALPDRVPADWLGPDSLQCINCVSNNFATLIFKSP